MIPHMRPATKPGDTRQNLSLRVLESTRAWLEERQRAGGYKSIGALVESFAQDDAKVALALFPLFKAGRRFDDCVLETGLSPATVRACHEEYVAQFGTSTAAIARLPLTERLRDARAKTRADLRRDELEMRRELQAARIESAEKRARQLVDAEEMKASAARATARMAAWAPRHRASTP
jgi:hypothetical protein